MLFSAAAIKSGNSNNRACRREGSPAVRVTSCLVLANSAVAWSSSSFNSASVFPVSTASGFAGADRRVEGLSGVGGVAGASPAPGLILGLLFGQGLQVLLGLRQKLLGRRDVGCLRFGSGFQTGNLLIDFRKRDGRLDGFRSEANRRIRRILGRTFRG